MGLIRFSVRQLEVFVAAAELESFGAAAGRLGLTPSAVSQLIGELESAVGLRLFDRTTRRVALSAGGRDLAGAARQALQQLQALAQCAADVRSRQALAATVLAEAVDAFLAEHPRARVQVCDTPVDHLVETVAQGLADLALGPDRPADPEVGCEPLFDSPWVLWCAPRHPLAQRSPLAWADLRGHALVATGRDHEAHVACMGAPAERIEPCQIVDHVTTALGLSAGARLATLAPAYVERLAHAFGLVARCVLGPPVWRQVCLYQPLRRTLHPVALGFAEHLRTHLGAAQTTGSTALTCPVPEATK
jgi:DNA-binding transcriptional LysR family regulator